MSFSAKRSAYSDIPSFSSQSAICCIGVALRTNACYSEAGRTESLPHALTYPSARAATAPDVVGF